MFKKNLFKIGILLLLCLVNACKQEPKTEPLYPKVAQSPEQLGKEIFEGKGNCVACHQPDQKIVGPSIQEIAKTYKDKNASIATFLKGESDPLVDPEQFEVMKTNFVITKTMSEDELKALETYIYSHLK